MNCIVVNSMQDYKSIIERKLVKQLNKIQNEQNVKQQ